MNDTRIIEMYENGFNIDYIAKIYCKYKNRNHKPVIIDGVKCFPVKLYTKSQCSVYVHSVIYSHIINKNKIV